jgi:hypothetical protein
MKMKKREGKKIKKSIIKSGVDNDSLLQVHAINLKDLTISFFIEKSNG